MDAKQAIQMVLDTSSYILESYLGDLSDEEILLRPVQGANQVAWQLGHLVVNEHRCLKALSPSHAVELDEQFFNAYQKECLVELDRSSGRSKETYMELLTEQRSLSLRYLDSLSTEQLDLPGPSHMRDYAPTQGAALAQQGIHTTMHCGQIAVLRRALNKPIVI